MTSAYSWSRRKIFRTERPRNHLKKMHHRCSEGEVVWGYMVGRFVVECWLLFCPMKHTTKSRGSLFLSEKSWDASCEKKSLVTQKNSNACFVPKSRPWRLPPRVVYSQSILDGAIRGEFGHAGGCLGQPKGVFPEIFKITVDASEIPKANNSDVSKTPWF